MYFGLGVVDWCEGKLSPRVWFQPVVKVEVKIDDRARVQEPGRIIT